ncbi:TDT family transporter [Catenulispora pinisilvae]|uniref:TDT family transporter n=1 Tax=Catenulispora pinisilvae TaxID=2705253 RepID=UPI001E5B80FF|nr:TDT family transporter [Catenulispora pinisilvae]
MATYPPLDGSGSSAARPDPAPDGGSRGRLGQMVSNVAANWYASVMGTGIVAIAAATLPQRFSGLHTAATAMWALSAFLLVVLVGFTAAQWRRDPAAARGRVADLTKGYFNGAPPVAVLVVGAGTLLYGGAVFGGRAALDIAWVLWFAGTLAGLVCAAGVLYLLFTGLPVPLDRVTIGWLMCMVPPMVSAATGALLVPHAAAGQVRLALLLCCYALFGLSLSVSAIATVLICYRMSQHKVGPAVTEPTLWIVLGPLGQSITAANALGNVAGTAIRAPDSTALRAFGIVFGAPTWGFATLWAGLALAITVRTKRSGLPFSLAWWSFTFPLGTYVTATSALALRTGSDPFRVYAAALYIALVLIWIRVAALTAYRAWRAGSASPSGLPDRIA